jgi:hypothetical protein
MAARSRGLIELLLEALERSRPEPRARVVRMRVPEIEVLVWHISRRLRIRTVIAQRRRQRSPTPRLLTEKLAANLIAQQLSDGRRHRVANLTSS